MKKQTSNKIFSIFLVIILVVISAVFYAELNEMIVFPKKYAEIVNAFHIFLIILSVIIAFFVALLIIQFSDNAEKQNVNIANIDIENIERKKKEEEEKKLKEEKERILSSVASVITDLNNPKDITKYCEKILSNLAKEFNIVQGLVFVLDKNDSKFKPISTYAFFSEEEIYQFSLGEGISGQVAKNKEILFINNIPENYITVLSGMGKSSPTNMCIFPLIHDSNTIGIIEIAAFKKFDVHAKAILSQAAQTFALGIADFIK